jgi:ribosome biogenesis protein BMS1
LQARFWTEVYDGAKLFYLSGMQHGKYLKREVSDNHKLETLIAKPKPSSLAIHYRLQHHVSFLLPPLRGAGLMTCVLCLDGMMIFMHRVG